MLASVCMGEPARPVGKRQGCSDPGHPHSSRAYCLPLHTGPPTCSSLATLRQAEQGAITRLSPLAASAPWLEAISRNRRAENMSQVLLAPQAKGPLQVSLVLCVLDCLYV